MVVTDNNRRGISKRHTDEIPQVKALQESISSIKHKYLVMSSQGGVGKTSVIVNLAVALSRKGLKVGLLDANYQAPDIFRMHGLESAVGSDSDKPFIPVAYSDDLKVASIESVMREKDGTGGWGKPLQMSDIRRFISSINWGSLDCLFVDTPAGPGEGLLTMIRSNPEARAIIITAPDIINRNRATSMINFFEKEKIPIFGWIENMRGFFCQHCGRRQELFSSGPGNRAIFLGDIPFLGRIPIDPHMAECADAGELFLEKYPESEVAQACNLIIDKILGGNRVNLCEDRSIYADL